MTGWNEDEDLMKSINSVKIANKTRPIKLASSALNKIDLPDYFMF